MAFNTATGSRHALIFFIVLVALVLVVVLVQTPPTEWARAQKLGESIESMGTLGVLLFITLTAVATSIGLPRQFFAFTAGFAFGVAAGVLLSSLGAIAGCAVTYFSSRYWFANRVRSKFPSIVKKLNRLLEKDVFLKIVVLRLQPLGTNLLTNLCAGVSNVSGRTFLLSTWFGYLPQMLVFSLFGAGVRIGSRAYLAYSLAMLCLSLAIGTWLYKRSIATRTD